VGGYYGKKRKSQGEKEKGGTLVRGGEGGGVLW
jgi:hypothetical protein